MHFPIGNNINKTWIHRVDLGHHLYYHHCDNCIRIARLFFTNGLCQCAIYICVCVCVFIIKWEEPQMHDVRWCKLLPHQQQEWNQRRERGQVNPQTYGGSHITSNLNVDEYKYETSVTHFWRASKKASKWLTIW